MEDEQKTAQYHVQNNSDIEGSALAAAQKQFSIKNYQEALNSLLSVANRNPDVGIFVDIGSCYYMMNKQREAVEYWQKAINIDGKNPRAYANLGNLYYKNGEIEKAISLWLVALIARPEDATTNLNLAIAFEKKSMRFEAIKYFEKYIKYCENKNSEEYIKIRARLQYCFSVANQYLTAGAKLQSEENNKKAAACYFKSLANYPNLSKTNLNLGSIFFTDKNLELAIKYWTIASHIDPNYDKIYSNLAISYDLLKKFDYAYCYYYKYMNYIMQNKEEYYKVNKRLLKIKPFLNQHPEMVKKHLELAKRHLANSEFYDAIDEFRIYSVLNPEEQNQYKDIIKKLESYLEPEISIISSCFEIGNKLVNEGRYSDAKPYFRRIMVLSSPKFLEYSKARAKYSQCEKAEAELDEV